MYVYYRATGLAEAKRLDLHDELPSEAGVTYWTDGIEPSRLYKGEGRVIVKITTSKPIPEHYKGIAEGVDSKGNLNSHREWVVPKKEFNGFLLCSLEDVTIVE